MLWRKFLAFTHKNHAFNECVIGQIHSSKKWREVGESFEANADLI